MRRAFTLLEILVVLAICALLSAMLWPVFAQARGMARRSACVARLHQIGLALRMYRDDCEELPPLLSHSFPGYVNDAQLFVCPNDGQSGHYAGNERLEGNTRLASGVSYSYFPRWGEAQSAGWYQPAPHFGPGKWDELTPLCGCDWHWAKHFDPNQDGNKPNSQGWELMLTLGGSVRKIRVEADIARFSPSQYS